MSDEVRIEGDVNEVCWEIEEGIAAERYARVQAANLQGLRQFAEAAGRVSYPLHSPLACGEMWSDLPGPEPTQPFGVRLRAALRRAGLGPTEEAPDARG